MNKNFIIKVLKILSVFLVIAGLIYAGFYYKKYNFKINNEYSINTDENIVRIYYDFASIPSIYQVYDFVNQSPNAVSFVKWDRIPDLDKKVKNKENVYVMEHEKKDEINPIDSKQILDYIAKHPDKKIIFHSNNMWFKNVLPLLNSLPADAVEEIHLYEDGSYSTTYKMHINQETDFIRHKNTFLKKYKVIYHMEDAKYMNSFQCLLHKRCTDMKMTYKNDIVVQNSIYGLRDKLKNNEKLKNDYFEIFGFDYKKYEKEMTHPFGIYFFTLYRNDEFAKKQMDFVEALFRGNLSYLNKDKNTKWFYKEHPAIRAKKTFEPLMRKQYPEVTRIEKHLPIELLMIADIKPDYVAGYSSSVFMNVEKDTIIAFIKRPKDPYMYIIRRNHILRPGRAFNIDDVSNIKGYFKRFVSRIEVVFQK